MREELAWWQHGLFICGNDGEGAAGGGGGSTEGTPAAGGGGGAGGSGTGTGDPAGGEGEGEGEGDEGDEGDEPIDDKDVAGLKSALAKERNSAKTNAKSVRALEKQLRDAQKKLDEAAQKDLSEVEKATKALAKSQETTTKLASRLRTQAVDALIERYARDMKFIDVDDALSGVDRSKIEVEQDDDDPADIQVDAKTAKAAVKALADKKKHLIQGEEDGSGGPSGSRFGGGNNGGGEKNSAEALKKLYPSLR